ncbi:flippase-like domain-containing protein, partial [Candidatus Saccharibacteria bacterium]|nr:flippase-like domain-containing protein [Candidatus Saccharibacteria bacterium]
GVSACRATMAQIIRYVMMFASFMIMILLSVIFLSLDQGVDRLLISISIAMSFMTIVSAFTLIFFFSSRTRMVRAAKYTVLLVNNLAKFVTFGKKKHLLKAVDVEKYFVDIYHDYIEIQQEKKILLKPLMWGVVANVLDVCLIAVAFLALGFWVNPAVLFVALGISSFAAIFAATPGGSGVYEAIMITFLASAGVPADVAIAGTLLARVTLFAGTICFGFLFYQMTIHKYGKMSDAANS